MTDPFLPVERSDPPRSPARELEKEIQIDDFVIERRLGAGGMGIVYQARQISLNRTVALKVLGQALTSDTDVVRFQREAQAAARLRHPAIAQVYFIGQDRHLCYMAMELVDGVSLRQVLDHLGSTTSSDTSLDSVVQQNLARNSGAVAVRFDVPTEVLPASVKWSGAPQENAAGPNTNPYLSPKARDLRTSLAHIRRCAELVRDAAAALEHAHEQGVVHRDIKPDNLLLDRQGKLHLIDFGVARFFEDQAVTCTGQLVGTPQYMSPEQVAGRGNIDARTDIYSLGLVLYELLTLRRPVESLNRENLLRNIVTKPLPPVTWRNEAAPEDLVRIVHRATQKDPDQRYTTARAMVDDLNRFLAGKTVAAPPYHYRIDEREIAAARPSGVVLSAFVISLIAAFVALGIASVGLMTMFMGVGVVIPAVQLLTAGAIAAGGILVSRSLLAAHPWARWTGVAILALICLGSSLGIIGLLIAASSISVLAQSSASEVPSAAEVPAESTPSQGAAAPDLSRILYGMIGMYSLPLLVALALGAAGLSWLMSRRCGEWFAFASQLRLEHHALKESLQ